MRTFLRLLSLFYPLSNRLGLCGNIGFIAGLLAGFIISTMAWAFRGFYMSNNQALVHALSLTLFTWIAVIYLLGILAKFTFRSVALPSLFNCLLTCFLTTFVCKWLDIFSFAWLAGMFIGALVGMTLCRINSLIEKT